MAKHTYTLSLVIPVDELHLYISIFQIHTVFPSPKKIQFLFENYKLRHHTPGAAHRNIPLHLWGNFRSFSQFDTNWGELHIPHVTDFSWVIRATPYRVIMYWQTF